MASRFSVNDDMLINVSRMVLEMLMNRTSRVAVEVLIELGGHGAQEWMNADHRTNRQRLQFLCEKMIPRGILASFTTSAVEPGI